MQPLPATRYHPRLIEAALALHDNRLHDAEPLLKHHLKVDPFDVAAIRMLAELAGRIGRYKDAESLLRRAIELAYGRPANDDEAAAWTAYADRHGLPNACRMILNSNEFLFVD